MAKLRDDEKLIVAILSEADKLGDGFLDNLIERAESSEIVKVENLKTKYIDLLTKLLQKKKKKEDTVDEPTEETTEENESVDDEQK